MPDDRDALMLATRLPTAVGWSDLVVPNSTADALQLLCRHAALARQAASPLPWFLDNRRGTLALFAGESGTGKTLAARVIATALGRELHRVDLAVLVSGHLSATLRRLDRLLADGAQKDWVLLFGEADAVFGRRSDVSDAHDRYANLETSCLLQRLEAYDGVAILSSNRRAAIDPAFLRRLRYAIDFPRPEPLAREQIWRRAFPAAVDIGALDFVRLAQVDLTGGLIHHVAQHAGLDAALAGEPVSMHHVEAALSAERGRLGHLVAADSESRAGGSLGPLVTTEPAGAPAGNAAGPAPTTSAPTAVTAFVGRTPCGPTDVAVVVASFSEFEQHYGGSATDCPLRMAVRQFFANGGMQAVIARVIHRNARGEVDQAAPITDADIVAPTLAAARRGLWLLDTAPTVNLLVIPPLAPGIDVAPATWDGAVHYATARHAFVIVDAPAAWRSCNDALAGVDHFVPRAPNAALYFPRLRLPDPDAGGAIGEYAPGGAVAGLYARCDASRGVWAAPAGLTAELRDALDTSVPVNDAELQRLNPKAINAIRRFAPHSPVAWSARTLIGADGPNTDWKYVSVRRTALFLQSSLAAGLAWTAFESNGEPLWTRVRQQAALFLQDLYRQGAFQGRTSDEAYFVNCDLSTTTQADIDAGTVKLLIGVALLRPSEFVVLPMALRAASSG